jgi:hypothetical protein
MSAPIGPQLPTIHEVRAHNQQQDNLGDCIILPPHLHERTMVPVVPLVQISEGMPPGRFSSLMGF